MDIDLRGKCALVVGGTTKLSATIAHALAEHGARVAVVDSAPAAEKLAAELGGEHLFLPVASLSDPEAAQGAVESAIAQMGRVDIVVGPPCQAPPTSGGGQAPAQWTEALDGYLRATFSFCKAAARPLMKQRGGRIILLGSAAGLVGCYCERGLAAASGGVFGLTRTAARELAGRGVTVNCVAVGLIADEQSEAMGEEMVKRHLDWVPLARLGSAEDVAHAVLFLASDAAGYITGQVLCVDGGMVMG